VCLNQNVCRQHYMCRACRVRPGAGSHGTVVPQALHGSSAKNAVDGLRSPKAALRNKC
jgi:hypothetical protein